MAPRGEAKRAAPPGQEVVAVVPEVVAVVPEVVEPEAAPAEQCWAKTQVEPSTRAGPWTWE
jgi:hypothetical protein